jgi:hypothetical protein
MKWYYESNGRPQGPILESELRQLKADGKIEAACLVWREGMDDWMPLEKVGEIASPSVPATNGEPKPLSLAKKPPAVPAEEPAAALAADKPASAAPSPESISSAPPDHCPPETGDDREGTNASAASAEPNGDGPLVELDWAPRWDNPGPSGPLPEFLPSVIDVIFAPGRVFSNLKPNGGWGLPLAFMAILNAVGTALVLWTFEQLPQSGSALSRILQRMHTPGASKTLLVASILGSTLALPLTVLVKAAFLHAFMRFMAGSRARFSLTFRTICYSMGATSALWVVPLAAVWLSGFSGDALVVESALLLAAGATGIWSLQIVTQSLASAHGVSLWRAAMAVILPPFVLSILLGVALASLAG